MSSLTPVNTFRVELVMIAGDEKKRSFALKQMKKSQIVETRQQQHIMSEKVGPEWQDQTPSKLYHITLFLP